MPIDRRAGQSAAAHQQVRLELLRAHYAQIPVIALAPSGGGLYTVWVLWGKVDNRWLVIAITAVLVLSALRLWLWRRFRSLPPQRHAERRWAVLAVAAAGVSGLIWGSAAPLLYPARAADYQVYLVVLLTLLPIVPMAALAAYMPTLYTYFLPCIAPFVVTLALRPTRAEHLTALLLVLMMAAMLTFARRYGRSLAEATLLRVQLAEGALELQRAMRQRSQFIAAASHDLREPVHAMSLFVASLRADDAGPVDPGLMRHLDASLRSLRGMLDNMLDLSRLDAAAVAPVVRDVALHSLLGTLADEYRPLAAQRGLSLRLRSPRAWTRSDPALLERMLRNLLSNALKYTLHGGVALVCRRSGRCWRVQVVDTGVGIAADRIDEAFAEFRRLADPDVGAAEGLGLGLSIVQRMAALLEHRLTVRSVPGRGSVFTVELPRTEDGADEEAPALPPLPVDAAMRPVLVIDNDPAVAAGTAALLRSWGLRTSASPSVDAALARADAEVPMLLIVDYTLAAGQSGFDAVEQLRRCWGVPVPAIVITGDTTLVPLRQAAAAGYLLLHKPVDPRRLRLCVAQACAVPAATD